VDDAVGVDVVGPIQDCYLPVQVNDLVDVDVVAPSRIITLESRCMM
jgi:hypothetical protein